MRAIQRIRGLPGEQVIPVVTPIQIEVHIKPRLVRQFGLAPFRHQDRIRIHCAHSADHILPHGDGRLLVLRVELYERIRHIHPKPIASQFEPILHDLHHGLPGGHGSRCVRRLLPWSIPLVEAIIQGRLRLEEVQNVGAIPIVLTSDEWQTRPIIEGVFGPNVAVGEFVRFRLCALLKPGVLLTGVARHQVE